MNKSPLVFIPGWGADKRCWQNLEPLLSPYFNCSHAELPFFESKPISTWQNELTRLAEEIPNGSVVIAWSLGGMLATQLAHQFPNKIKSLVLIATNPSFIARQTWHEAMPLEAYQAFCDGFSQTPTKTIKRFNALQAQGYVEKKYRLKQLSEISVFSDIELDLGSAAHGNASALLSYLGEIDNSSVLFELSQPVLNIFSDKDALVPIELKNEIESKCAVSQSKNMMLNTIVSDCGHAPQLTHAGRVFEEISSFLDVESAKYLRDKKKVAQSFSKASLTYDSASVLQLKVANKLSVCSVDVHGVLLDLGCGTGYCIDALKKREDVHGIVGLDIAFSMLESAKKKIELGKAVHWCNADLESIPLAAACVDTIVSSLAIQWADSLEQVFSEAARVIKRDGRFLVSSLGPKTLNELSRAWQKTEPDFIHVNRFNHAEEVMTFANKAGFETEFFEVNYDVLQYSSAIALMKDLKAIGAHNVNLGSRRGLTGKRALAEVEKYYIEDRLPNGQLPATYEVYYWVFHKRK